MTQLTQIWNAALGWRDLLRGDPGWRRRFVPTREGLGPAMVAFLVVIALNIVVQAVGAEGVTPLAILVNLIVNLLPLVGLGLAIAATVLVLGLRPVFYDLLIPAVYALSLMLLVGLPLSFTDLPVGPVLLLGLGYLLVKLGQAAAEMKLTLAIAFAGLCLLLLVALPLSLYMVIAPGPGPI